MVHRWLGVLWVCAAWILPAFRVMPGVPFLVMLMILATGNNARRVRGALAAGNSPVLEGEIGGLLGVNAGMLASWFYLVPRIS